MTIELIVLNSINKMYLKTQVHGPKVKNPYSSFISHNLGCLLYFIFNVSPKYLLFQSHMSEMMSFKAFVFISHPY